MGTAMSFTRELRISNTRIQPVYIENYDSVINTGPAKQPRFKERNVENIKYGHRN